MISQQARDFIELALEAINPPPSMSVSEYADLHRILPSDEAEGGQWRTDRTPYAREPMDCMTPSDPCRVAVWMAGSQIGKTEALILNCLAYWIDIAPGRIIHARPDEDDAADFSKQRLQPMIDLNPRLQAKVSDGKTDNTMLKDFPGGSLKLTGARAPAGLRSKPVPYVAGDEIDNWPASAGTEGDPLYLLMKRQSNYPDRKTGLVSTPLDDEDSRILEWFLRGDRCTYWLPCPHCDELFVLEWALFVIPQDENGKKLPEETHVVCPSNGCIVEDGDKEYMLPRGVWRPMDSLDPAERMAALRAVGLAGENGVDERVELSEATRRKDIRSFHMASFYSPVGWFSWADIGAEFLLAYKDPTKFKIFVNTVWAQTWKQADGKTVSKSRLYKRREIYEDELPRTIAFITAGVDVQHDRIELEIVGWGRGFESWSIDYVVIPGDPSGKEVWRDLDTVLRRRFAMQGGGALRIEATGVDSGHETHQVYKFTKKRTKRRIWAVKGANEDSKKELEVWPQEWNRSKLRGGSWSFKRVGTNRCKREIYTRLDIDEPGPGYCHFPEDRSQTWFAQLTAEKWISKLHKGRAYLQWHLPSGKQNEALDCRVYSYAAAVGLERAGRTIDGVLDKRERRDAQRKLDAEAAGVETTPRRQRLRSPDDDWIPERDW